MSTAQCLALTLASLHIRKARSQLRATAMRPTGRWCRRACPASSTPGWDYKIVFSASDSCLCALPWTGALAAMGDSNSANWAVVQKGVPHLIQMLRAADLTQVDAAVLCFPSQSFRLVFDRYTKRDGPDSSRRRSVLLLHARAAEPAQPCLWVTRQTLDRQRGPTKRCGRPYAEAARRRHQRHSGLQVACP